MDERIHSHANRPLASSHHRALQVGQVRPRLHRRPWRETIDLHLSPWSPELIYECQVLFQELRVKVPSPTALLLGVSNWWYNSHYDLLEAVAPITCASHFLNHWVAGHCQSISVWYDISRPSGVLGCQHSYQWYEMALLLFLLWTCRELGSLQDRLCESWIACGKWWPKRKLLAQRCLTFLYLDTLCENSWTHWPSFFLYRAINQGAELVIAWCQTVVGNLCSGSLIGGCRGRISIWWRSYLLPRRFDHHQWLLHG